MTEISEAASGATGLPVQAVTVNQVVGFNMAWYRKAAGLTQEELGQRLGGWTKVAVSAAERSWDGKRIRKFDADEITRIAAGLGIPPTALFLPPEDHGTVVRYVLDAPRSESDEPTDLLTLMFPEYKRDSPAMSAYRQRLIGARAGEREPVDDLDTAEHVEHEPVDDLDTAEHVEHEPVDNLDTAERVLALAQQVADAAIGDARKEVDHTFERARRQADEMLTKARRQAEQITGDARARAESLERDARERHRHALMSLVVSREELERRVDDLRAFEREYRSRLMALLESQLTDLRAGAPDGRKFILEKTESGKYHFTLVDTAGQTIASSGEFEEKQLAMKAIAALRYASAAEIDDQASE